MYSTNPENAAIVDRLAAALAELPIDTILSYERLSATAGCDVRKKGYLLIAARTRTEKALGCILEAVKGIGITRLPSHAAPDVGLSSLRSIRRKAKRGASRLDHLQINSLTDGEARRVIAYKAMLSTVVMMADGNKARTIAAVADITKPIPPQNILDMFRKD